MSCQDMQTEFYLCLIFTLDFLQMNKDFNKIHKEIYSHFTNWYQRHRLGGGVKYFTWMTLKLLLVLAV